MSSNSIPTIEGAGSGVSIGSWFLLVVSALAIFTRLGTKLTVEGVLNLDDFLAIGALVTNTASTIAVHFQSENGLSVAMNQLDAVQLSKFLKASYATGLLYIATLCFAKLSIIALMRKISPDKFHRSAGLALGIFIAVGSFVFEVAAALECQTPNVWDTLRGQCYERKSFWRVLGAFEITLDIGLIALPLYIIIPLHMRSKPKLLVLSSFSTRAFDIATVAAQLVFTNGFDSSDPTGSIWQWTLLAQIAQCISIVTSCVPYLRPLLESLPSGLMLSDDLQRRTVGGGSYPPNYYAQGKRKSKKLFRNTGTTLTTTKSHDNASPKEESDVYAPPDGGMELCTARNRWEAYGNRADTSVREDINDLVQGSSSTSLHSQRRLLPEEHAID